MSETRRELQEDQGPDASHFEKFKTCAESMAFRPKYTQLQQEPPTFLPHIAALTATRG